MTSAEWAEYRGCITNDEQGRIQRRLMQVAREAIKSSPRNWDGAKDAFYAKVRKDADLLWELFSAHRAQAAQFWLSQASAAIRDEERPRLVADTKSDAGHCPLDDHLRSARVAPNAFAAQAAAIAHVTHLSLLDTFKANGKPIGELTPEEANKWAGSRERDARFVRMLTANLPPDQPIKKYRTPEDAAAMYARAESDHAE